LINALEKDYEYLNLKEFIEKFSSTIVYLFDYLDINVVTVIFNSLNSRVKVLKIK
jgi:hypothetical protein